MKATSHRVLFTFTVLTATFAATFAASFANAEVSTKRSYQQVREYIETIQKTHADTTSMFVVGKSNQGEDIVGIKIGTGAIHNLIVATHHGNEYGSTEVALAAADDLAAKPVAGQTIYLIPVLNITGFNVHRREETLKGAGYAGTVDPNRDYPGPCGTYGPFHLASTKALADFVERENIVSAATLHTFYGSVCYPWGISSHDLRTRDEADFVRLANKAASVSGYEVGNSTQIMYPADGTFEDYSYWKLGIWSLLFEMGSTHSPDVNELRDLVKSNVPGLRAMMEGAPTKRSVNHAFEGRCDARFRALDRRDE